jgi:desulfoferrodoxin (superoxide reductase-like protein)
MPGAATLGSYGAPDDHDAWDEAKTSPLVDTCVEAAVVMLIAVLANCTLHALWVMAGSKVAGGVVR